MALFRSSVLTLPSSKETSTVPFSTSAFEYFTPESLFSSPSTAALQWPQLMAGTFNVFSVIISPIPHLALDPPESILEQLFVLGLHVAVGGSLRGSRSLASLYRGHHLLLSLIPWPGAAAMRSRLRLPRRAPSPPPPGPGSGTRTLRAPASRHTARSRRRKGGREPLRPPG